MSNSKPGMQILGERFSELLQILVYIIGYILQKLSLPVNLYHRSTTPSPLSYTWKFRNIPFFTHFQILCIISYSKKPIVIQRSAFFKYFLEVLAKNYWNALVCNSYFSLLILTDRQKRIVLQNKPKIDM